jgi:Na+/H+ antiporter NhaD/arsenite permease-like protein
MGSDYSVVIALIVFTFVYVMVVTDWVNRTKAAFFGALVLLLGGVIDLETAWVEYIDFETLGLLVGMMVIAGVIGQTGIFQFTALKAVRWTRGRYGLLMVTLCVITAVFSAFLDNVTTILLLGPIAIIASDALHRKPLLLLIAITFASNIGGMATLIGDPPHMMIGSAVGLSFNDFLVNLAPMSIIALAVTLGLIYLSKRHIITAGGKPYRPTFDEARYIKDKRQTVIGLVVLGLVIVGFTILPEFGIPVAVVALFGASALMLLNPGKVKEQLGHIEWPLIFFFIGLFVITGALQEVGVIAWLGRQLAGITTDPLLFTMIVLWASTIGVALFSAVPYVAVMIPIVSHAVGLMGLGPAAAEPIWWSLAISVAIAGNATIVGSAATMAAVSISERTNEPITFRTYLRYGLPTMLLVQLCSTAYLWLRYFVPG